VSLTVQLRQVRFSINLTPLIPLSFLSREGEEKKEGHEPLLDTLDWCGEVKTRYTMRALSVKQPWAWLIVNGYKKIENRNWPTSFRGRIYIHAGRWGF